MTYCHCHSLSHNSAFTHLAIPLTLSHPFMEQTIEEQVLKENVLEDRMKCLLCNVTAVNLPTWESHKKGKK